MCNEQRYTESGAPIAPARCKEYTALKEENARLREALAPLLAHADSHDYAPPLKFSAQRCREIRGAVNAND